MSRKPAPLKFHRPVETSAFYRVSQAAVRNWRRIGRLAGDPFPQENPVEVVRWYCRNFKKGCPSRLLEVAQRWSGKEIWQL